MLLERKLSIAGYLRNIRFGIFCVLAIFLAISKAALEITFAMIFFLWIAENILINKWKIKEYFPKTKLNLPIIVLAAVLLISIFNSVEPQLSLRKFFTKWAQHIMLYFLTVDIINSKKKFKSILLLFSLSLGLIFVDGIWQLITGTDFLHARPIEGLWIRAHFNGLNVFGGLLVLMSPIVITFLLSKTGRENAKAISLKRIYGGILSILFIVCLIFNCSVVAWVAITAAFV
ncbi:MAG: hypothetical protein ABIH08_01970, partial [Candidatus Omnitrophota bacterium]